MAGRVVLLWSMSSPLPRADDILRAPDAFRDALTELVGIGMSVARMIGLAAETETALAQSAAQATAEDGVSPMPNSLAEAIEADRAAAAAGEARETVVARTHAVAGAYTEVSRAVRRTVLLAERLDRGWAGRPLADDQHAMAKRQIERGVRDAIEREADGSRADTLNDALMERMDSPDTMDEISLRSADDIIRTICGELKLGLTKLDRGSAPNPVRGQSSSAHLMKRGEGDDCPLPGGGQSPPLTPSNERPPPDRTSPHR